MKIALIFLLLIPVSHAVIINEVMYDPAGSDSSHEWIEFYNNDNITYNITDWKLVTDNTNHGINNATILENNSYIVICQDIDTFLLDYQNVSAIDSSWSDLSNTADETILIKNSTEIFDNITQSSLGQGASVCRINDTFVKCNPTPGYANEEFIVTTDAAIYLNTTFRLNETSTLFTVSIENCTAENITLNYTISGTNYTETLEVNCTAHLQGLFNETGIYEVCGEIYRNETNTTNNAICGTVNVSDYGDDSYIIIKSVNPSSVQFGEDVNVELEIYRNTTNKYAVYVSVPGISETTVYHALKNATQTVTLPVRIKPDCDGSYANGVYTVLAEGLDTNSTASVTLSGISSVYCKVEYVTTSSGGGGGGSYVTPQNTNTLLEKYEITSYPASVFVDEEFEVAVEITSPTKKNLEVYSYVYKGTNPVSLGLDGDTWKGNWDANAKEIVVNNNKVELKLKNKIEEGTEAGTYTLKVKIKGDKEYELTKTIEVAGDKPKIIIEKGNVTTLTTNCDDCEILLLGQGIDKKAAQHTLGTGTFYAILMKDSRILTKEEITVEDEKTSGAVITGFAVKKRNLDPYVNYLELLMYMDLV